MSQCDPDSCSVCDSCCNAYVAALESRCLDCISTSCASPPTTAPPTTAPPTTAPPTTAPPTTAPPTTAPPTTSPPTTSPPTTAPPTTAPPTTAPPTTAPPTTAPPTTSPPTTAPPTTAPPTTSPPTTSPPTTAPPTTSPPTTAPPTTAPPTTAPAVTPTIVSPTRMPTVVLPAGLPPIHSDSHSSSAGVIAGAVVGALALLITIWWLVRKFSCCASKENVIGELSIDKKQLESKSAGIELKSLSLSKSKRQYVQVDKSLSPPPNGAPASNGSESPAFTNPRARKNKHKNKCKGINRVSRKDKCKADGREVKSLLQNEDHGSRPPARNTKSICPDNFYLGARQLSGVEFEGEWTEAKVQKEEYVRVDHISGFGISRIKACFVGTIVILADGMQNGEMKCFFYAETTDGVLAMGSITHKQSQPSCSLTCKSMDPAVCGSMLRLVKSNIGRLGQTSAVESSDVSAL